MPSKIVSSTQDRVTLQIEVPLKGTMLEMEAQIQHELNQAGVLVTGEALSRFDTDGAPLVMGKVKWTSKGQERKSYQSPYGEVDLARHVYQTSRGGSTFCPLDQAARIVVSSTPRFAKQVSSKYTSFGAPQVVEDLYDNHGRKVAQSYVQNLADAVGSVVQAKEEQWHYATPKLDEAVQTLAIGMDGTCMLTCHEGYREAMVGSLSLYDCTGERQHTIYLAATPEYGKATFKERMEREIAHIKAQYPGIRSIGVADGAAENWTFLENHTDVQILDFYHASEYLADVAEAVFGKKAERVEWLDDRCHRLKHKQGAASRLIHEMEQFQQRRLTKRAREAIDKALTYFRNHKHQMHYARFQAEGLPIGSGVTEAACKSLVKQRLCGSGMRWKEKGAGIVLSLRSLIRSTGRWNQFWDKVNQYGFPVAV